MITICVALEAELPDFKMNGYTVIYTGVGKVQAATALAKSLCHVYKPVEIWNYGTAGGVSGISGLHEVGSFLQRDMMAEPQAPRGSIPFTEPLLGEIQTSGQGIRCGTGDSFVMEPDPWFEQQNIDCVDMEGWALAYVAREYNIKFRSFKYISDMADENAMDDWTTNVANGAEIFTEKVRNGI
jgi:adenosylhomocysteine nucleosidase|tara:strand:+ start:5708 stop:6256 length:549 start_codon:yes stop_codon:yes gene_type:complete